MSSDNKLQFYKLSLYSTIAFLIVMTVAFSYTIHDFQRGIKASVELELGIVRQEVTKAIELSSSTDLSDFTDLLTQQLVGSIIPFDTDNCPSGWIEFKPAYGRFIRGVDKGTKKIDPQGQRIVGSLQGDSTKLPNNSFKGRTNNSGKHSHKYRASRPYNSGAGAHARAKHDGGVGTTESSGEHSHKFTVTDGGDSETRPKNVALLYCKKL